MRATPSRPSVSLLRRSTSLAGEAGHRPAARRARPAPAPRTRLPRPVATARTARSATASFTPGIRRMAVVVKLLGSAASCSRDSRIRSARFSGRPTADLTQLSLGRQGRGWSLPAGQQRPQRPYLRAGEAFQQNLRGDHLPAGPGLQPGTRSARGSGTIRPAGRRSPASMVRLAAVQPGTGRSARPSRSPTSGGTALPICRNAADGGPANRNRSGKVCSRAASRTVRVRFCRGWMYQ